MTANAILQSYRRLGLLIYLLLLQADYHLHHYDQYGPHNFHQSHNFQPINHKTEC